MRAVTPLVIFLLPLAMFAQDQMTVMRTAHRDMDHLCGPDMYGRGYVNGGDSIAAAYLTNKFKQFELGTCEGTYLQPFAFPVNTFPIATTVKVDGKLLEEGVDYLIGPNSGSDQGTFEIKQLDLGEVINGNADLNMVGDGGNVALMLKQPATKDRDTLALFRALSEEFQNMGPVLSSATGKLVWGVSLTAAPHVAIEFAEGAIPAEAKTVTIDVNNKLIERHRANNVVGCVRGSKKKKDLIVVTAHYDHLGMMGDAMFPGANDNASGTSMLLALAEHFSRNPAPKTVVFMLFAGEEAGLIGSRYFVEHPLVDLERIDMLVNLDIMGTGDDGIMMVNASKEPEIYDRLVKINESSDRLAAVKKRGPSCNSDHCPFSERGVPSVFIYTLGGIAEYHNVNDRSSTLPLTDFYDIFLSLIELIEQS